MSGDDEAGAVPPGPTEGTAAHDRSHDGAHPTLRRLARVRPTRRGLALLLAGLALAATGALLELPDVVGLGAAAVLAVLLAWTLMGVQRLDAGRGALVVTRELTPNPVVRDQTAAVRLVVGARARTGAAYERLARLRLSEQAAHELAGPHGIRARVTAHADRIAVSYALTPSRRGRWALGPLITTRTDVFGLVRTTQPLGVATRVAVWPRTTELPTRTRVLGEVDRAATGARLASTDDSVLREYVSGDDPRRVHWAGSARQGRLMVRADESAGVRPVTVLLDRSLLPPPADPRTGVWPSTRGTRTHAEGERAVELAASVATSFLDAGHPARLVPTGSGPAPVPFASGARTGRGTILDSTVDLRGHRSAADAERAVLQTVRSLRAARSQDEITVAVLGPQPEPVLREMAELGVEGTCWALLVAPADTREPGATPAADTVGALRAAGWRVATCSPGTPPDRAWALLAEGAA
ncbi:DUF58 domain-containing protein [Krasilnikoviella flava]|uniref:Uncharacterized conserved protein, DUF58 family, contains vWF domain n=1 Tax=Krasilnikoviella flava TaxID=526729 RepID=A0A1T5LU60_9MICO|nr:DUF58 domain-containing protein [Krasilnikoviella flava]SKC79421.1 Uncharacterized conserved protein, DUF58 family, contains vWF domain [Krasilnikoviella flava]